MFELPEKKVLRSSSLKGPEALGIGGGGGTGAGVFTHFAMPVPVLEAGIEAGLW